ncbi:hypothetical protein SHKM778_67310 [Streptomyces sp. KM77-8]|uniref:Uncharacterized protein n=1 Tax=Streptomyces haneummycinicus TaxID=3074435 RepID=A0AAT9HS22_9ACTN
MPSITTVVAQALGTDATALRRDAPQGDMIFPDPVGSVPRPETGTGGGFSAEPVDSARSRRAT